MISIRIAGGKLSFRLIPTLLTAIMLPVLVGLGSWQIQRLHWKESLIAAVESRSGLPEVDAGGQLDLAEVDYRPARASGIFHNDKLFYLLALSREGAGGYHVLSPLQLPDKRFLLVDRGWIPYDHRPNSEAAAAPPFFLPQGIVTLSGILRIPVTSFFQPKNDPIHNNWYSIDLKAMAKTAGLPDFLPYVFDMKASDAPGGFPIGGQTRMTFVNNHLVYAITWFGMALALAIVFLIASFQGSVKNSSER